MCATSAQSDSLSAQEAEPWPVAGGCEGGLSPEAAIVEGGKKRGNRKDIDAVLGALRSIAEIDDHPSPEPHKTIDCPQPGEISGNKRRLRLCLHGCKPCACPDQEVDLDLPLRRRPLPQTVEGMARTAGRLAISTEQLPNPSLEERPPLGGRGGMKLPLHSPHDAAIDKIELRMAPLLDPQPRFESRQAPSKMSVGKDSVGEQARLAEERLIKPLVEQIDPMNAREYDPRPGAFSRATHAEQKKTPLPRRHEDAVIWPRINHAVIYTGKMTARLRDPEFGMKPERMRREPCLASLAVEKAIHAPLD